MARSVTEIRSLARSHTRTALNVLVAVMRNTKATPPARMAQHAILAQIHQMKCRGTRFAHAPKLLPTLPFRK
jgi:hypothetical protein